MPQPEELEHRARRYRTLARDFSDSRTRTALLSLADEYEAQAAEIRSVEPRDPSDEPL
jgi:hypothetical protein